PRGGEALLPRGPPLALRGWEPPLGGRIHGDLPGPGRRRESGGPDRPSAGGCPGGPARHPAPRPAPRRRNPGADLRAVRPPPGAGNPLRIAETLFAWALLGQALPPAEGVGLGVAWGDLLRAAITLAIGLPVILVLSRWVRTTLERRSSPQ